MKRVRTRIAPSPTGRMHVGTVRGALFNYLFAKKHGGDFVVRIEDTDRERSRKEYEDSIWEDFAWVHLPIDEKYRQSEHLPRHIEAVHHMLERGTAYLSKEPSKADPSKMVEVVRLKNPNKRVTFNDLIRGSVSFDTTELGDFVIARAIDDPLYHLAVVVDDEDEKITHVLRAEEHISNTPRQILIQEALGFDRPEYGHLPLILAPDRTKLSKRKHAASIGDLRQRGYLPEAILNFLVLLGWSPGDDRELFTLSEMVEAFSLEGIHKAGAIFNEEKLRWFNKEYIRTLPEGDIHTEIRKRFEAAAENALPDSVARKVAPIILERVSAWGDVEAMVHAGEWDFLLSHPHLDHTKLVWKNSTKESTKEHLTAVLALLEALPESAFETSESVKAVVWPYAESHGRGDVLWPLRYSLTGKDKSPDPFTCASLIGKEATISRIQAALRML